MNTHLSLDDLPALAEALLPFLDRLKKGADKTKTPPCTPPRTIYLPELDYCIHHNTVLGQFREGGFAPEGAKGDYIMPPVNMKTLDPMALPVGLCATGGNNDLRHHYIIPTPTLRTLITQTYAMPYALDYRMSSGSRTMYMRGILDLATGDIAARNLSARVIDWSAARTEQHLPQVIANTRAFWETMPDDGGKSIVTKATMMQLLDDFEYGLCQPGQVRWHIDITSTGAPNTLPFHAMDSFDWNSPQKISIEKA